MKITTNGQAMSKMIKVMSLVPQKAADAQVKSFTNRETGVTETKTNDKGQPLYRASFNVVSLDENGQPARQESDISISLVKPADVVAGQFYLLSGEVVVTHYVTSNNRLGVSIVAETVVPESSVQQKAAQGN